MPWISSTAMGSTPAKGSSNKTNFGSTANARISVLLRSPPESTMPKFFRTCVRRTPPAFDLLFSFRLLFGTPRISSGAKIFSSTKVFWTPMLLAPDSQCPVWHVQNMGSWVMFWSSRKISPSFGLINPYNHVEAGGFASTVRAEDQQFHQPNFNRHVVDNRAGFVLWKDFVRVVSPNQTLMSLISTVTMFHHWRNFLPM